MSYTEGILGDGAAILKDGVMVPIEEVVSRLNDMDRFRAELENIANAKPSDWEDPWDFPAWAQNRARWTLAQK